MITLALFGSTEIPVSLRLASPVEKTNGKGYNLPMPSSLFSLGGGVVIVTGATRECVAVVVSSVQSRRAGRKKKSI